MKNEFQKRQDAFTAILRPSESFDIEERVFSVGGRQAVAWFVDALTQSALFEELAKEWMSIPADRVPADAQAFAAQKIPHTAAVTETDPQAAAEQALSGQTVLLVEGFSAYLVIDLREYPVRALKEPEEDRVMLGAHDGFTEAIKTNLALIRRRIRSADLRVAHRVVGEKSRTDVAVCWLEGTASQNDVDALLQKIERIRVGSLSLGHESISEALVKPRWFNPFPQFRYTERPDRAAAAVAEGKILLFVDNSPIVLMLPTALPDFLQDTNEYYFGPHIGTFLRWTRAGILLLSLFLIPVWYTVDIFPTPDRWQIFGELLIAELVLDAVKLATLHTPSSMGGMFGIIGALLLGEFAVKGDLFGEGVLLLMAFQAVATFVQPSFPLGYTFKFYRLLFTVMAAFFGWIGLLLGILIMIVTAANTRSVGGKGYLSPFFPFCASEARRLLFRRRIHKDNS